MTTNLEAVSTWGLCLLKVSPPHFLSSPSCCCSSENAGSLRKKTTDKRVHAETYCFSVSCSQAIGQLSGRWTDGLVWYCSSAVMWVVNQSIATHTHKYTHACTHRLMTLIQMACLLCVYWPALKGIFFVWQRNLSRQHSCVFTDFPCSCPD